MLQNIEGIGLAIVYDLEAAFTEVATGKLDAVVVDRWTGEYELAQGKIRNIQVIDEPIETHHSRIAVEKGNTKLLNSINDGLNEMNNDGIMINILDKWSSKRVIYFTAEYMRSIITQSLIGLIALILLIASYFINKYRKLSDKLKTDVAKRTEELRKSNELLLKANAELETISLTDQLTGIANRRGFVETYQKAWEMSKTKKQPIALIMIDVDHFKSFNDTYGHLAGDQCLIKVAKTLKMTESKTESFVSRYGGEEFIVMLLNTTEADAAVIAEEIRKKVEGLEIENEKTNSVITISLGVASTIPSDDMHPDELINQADSVLYQAKKDGRNKVQRWSLRDSEK